MKKIFAVLLILAATCGLSLVSSPAANAAGSCYFESCTKKDPQVSGCSADAYTIGYIWGKEIRFSPGCAASWLRSAPQTGNLTAEVKVTRPNNVYEYVYYGAGAYYGNESWSLMAPLQVGGLINWHASNSVSGWFNTNRV